MRHGPRDLALVSLDDARFGAQEQLRVLGRLLGVECYTLEDTAALAALLPRLSRHRLVLIDTAGISPRDRHMSERVAAIGEVARRGGVDLWLTLSAGAQAGVIGDAMQAFRAFDPRALLLTKLDEAASLGGILSALAVSKLPVAYVAGGPRIPEDLAPARAHQLVAPRYSWRAAPTPASARNCWCAGSVGWHMSSAESGFTAAQTEGIRAAMHPDPVQVIAVTGGKGGVGKTCVAINLAAALAAQGKRVLLLDGDLGLANADVQLGIAPKYTLEHVLDGRCTLEEAIIDTPAGSG